MQDRLFITAMNSEFEEVLLTTTDLNHYEDITPEGDWVHWRISNGENGRDYFIFIDDLTNNDFLYATCGSEIELLGHDQIIYDDSQIPAVENGTYFGQSTVDGKPSIQTFTIRNSGSDGYDLNLAGDPAVSLAHGTHFEITQPTQTTIDSGESVTFEIIFQPTSTGSFTDTVTIIHDDLDEGEFTFVISGTGVQKEEPTSTLNHLYLPIVISNRSP